MFSRTSLLVSITTWPLTLGIVQLWNYFPKMIVAVCPSPHASLESSNFNPITIKKPSLVLLLLDVGRLLWLFWPQEPGKSNTIWHWRSDYKKWFSFYLAHLTALSCLVWDLASLRPPCCEESPTSSRDRLQGEDCTRRKTCGHLLNFAGSRYLPTLGQILLATPFLNICPTDTMKNYKMVVAVLCN